MRLKKRMNRIAYGYMVNENGDQVKVDDYGNPISEEQENNLSLDNDVKDEKTNPIIEMFNEVQKRAIDEPEAYMATEEELNDLRETKKQLLNMKAEQKLDELFISEQAAIEKIINSELKNLENQNYIEEYYEQIKNSVMSNFKELYYRYALYLVVRRACMYVKNPLDREISRDILEEVYPSGAKYLNANTYIYKNTKERIKKYVQKYIKNNLL